MRWFPAAVGAVLPLLVGGIAATSLLGSGGADPRAAAPSVPIRTEPAPSPGSLREALRADPWEDGAGDATGRVRLAGIGGPGVAPTAGTIRRGPSPSPPERGAPSDPWGLGTAPAPSAEARYEHGSSCVARIDARGALTYDTLSWSVPAGEDGYELVAYDLAPLVPPAETLTSALSEGYAGTGSPLEFGSSWWPSLLEAVVDTVGRGRWPAPETLLAWEPDEPTLYVRQDEAGHRRVASYLASRASARSDAVGVRVELGPAVGGATPPLRLEVPWGPSVRTHVGTAWCYLQDFDVEVGQDMFIADPIVGVLDLGVGVSARRLGDGGSAEELEVEISCADPPPRITLFQTSLGGSSWPVRIELPDIEVARWRGRVPVTPGVHEVRLDDGRGARLVVAGVSTGPRLTGAVPGRVLPAPSEEASPRGASEPPGLVVTWAGPEGGRPFSFEVPLRPRRDFPSSPLRTGTCLVDLRRGTVEPAGAVTWPPVAGGIRLEVRALAREGADVLDLVVEVADPAHDVRSLEARPGVEPPEQRLSPPLPVCSVRREAHHVVLPAGGEARVTFATGTPRQTQIQLRFGPR